MNDGGLGIEEFLFRLARFFDEFWQFVDALFVDVRSFWIANECQAEKGIKTKGGRGGEGGKEMGGMGKGGFAPPNRMVVSACAF